MCTNRALRLECGSNMSNGKPGDHPHTDIVIHGARVYSDEIADLLWQEFNVFENPDVVRLERVLTKIRSRLTSK